MADPTDAEVREAIDELVCRAKSTVTGSSGHDWGRLSEVDRLASLLWEALRTKEEEREAGDYHERRENTKGQPVSA